MGGHATARIVTCHFPISFVLTQSELLRDPPMWFGRIALALTVRAKILTHDDLRPPPLSAARIFDDGQAVPLDG
jgi:hypothetical protein